MNTHKFKIVEIADKEKRALGCFDYRYVTERRKAIYEKCANRVLSELHSKGFIVSLDELTVLIVEGERENGYANQHCSEPYFYREDKKQIISIDELEKLLGYTHEPLT